MYFNHFINFRQLCLFQESSSQDEFSRNSKPIEISFALIYVMTGRAFVVAKEVLYRGNGNILTLRSRLNYEKHFLLCKFNYINNHLYFVQNFDHLKPRYTDPGHFLTKRALVS